MAAHSYNIILKAESIEEADEHIDEWLSTRSVSAAVLGYGEVMATIVTMSDYGKYLAGWLTATRPIEGRPFPPGALLWYKE